DDIEAGLGKVQGIFLRAAAAQANQRVEIVFFVILDDDLRHIARASVDQHAMRFIAAGAEDRAADGQDAGEGVFIEFEAAIFDDSAEAIAEPDDFHVVAQGRFADAANGRVETGTVAARREDAESFGFSHRLDSFESRWKKLSRTS